MKAQPAKLSVEVLEGRDVPSFIWVRVPVPGSTAVMLVRTEVPDTTPTPTPTPTPSPTVPAAPATPAPISRPTTAPAPTAPSAPAAPTRSTPVPTPVPTPTPSPTKLTGSGSGLYICNLQYVTTPTGFHFTGTATITGMGKVDVQADIYGVGFKDNAQANGTMTLSNAQGSLKLSLTGPLQAKLAYLPSQFQYKVASATGAYAKMKVGGSLLLVRTPDSIPIRSGIRYIETGSFRLTF